MSNKEAALTVVVLTDKGCKRVNHAEPGLSFIVERFTASAKEGERVAHVRDYRFRDESKAYAIWSLSPDQYQIVCEADEDAAIYYGPAIGKPLPETKATKPEQLPTSGRQGTTKTPLAALQEIEETLDAMLADESLRIESPVGRKLEALAALAFSARKPSNTRNWWALNATEARKLGLSCDDGNQITITAWKQEPLGSASQHNTDPISDKPDQIVSDRTAQHYTDPARE